MSYRYLTDLKKQYYDPAVRRVRSMLSWRRVDLDESDGDTVTALGREAEDGSVETDKMDMLSPVGLIARPEANATVETVVGYVGADGEHPVAINALDHTRRAVIDTVGLDADETIIYTSTLVIKLTADGLIEIRTLNGTAVPLATKADVDAVNARVTSIQSTLNTHVHLPGTYSNGGGAIVGASGILTATNSASATVNGTSVIMAE